MTGLKRQVISTDRVTTSAAPGLNRRSLSGRTHFPALGINVAMIIGLLPCLWTYVRPSSLTSIFAVASAFTALGFCAARIMSGPRSLRSALAEMRLGPWFGVGFALSFGISTFRLLKDDWPWYLGHVTQQNVTQGWPVALTGFLGFVCGYFATPKWLRSAFNSLDAVARGSGKEYRPGSVLILWGLAMFARSMQFMSGDLGYVTTHAGQPSQGSSHAALDMLVNLGIVATFLASWRLSRHAMGILRVQLVLVCGSQLLISLLTGMKEDMLMQFFAVAIGMSLGRTLKVWPLLASVAIAVVFVTPFVNSYRAQLNAAGRSLTPAEAVSSINIGALLRDALTGQRPGTASDNDISFLQRTARLGDVTMITSQTPEVVPRIHVFPLVSSPVVSLVPRSLWPQKPRFAAASDVYLAYYGRSGASSPAVTPYGDLWRYGGYATVLGGMTLLGAAARLVDSRGTSNRMAASILPFLLFPIFWKQETDMATTLASFFPATLAAALAYRIVTRRNAASKTPRS